MPRYQTARSRLLGTGKQAQQRGLARAVEAEHHHSAAPVDRQVDAGEDFQRAVDLGQVLHHQRRFAAGGGLRELDLGHLVGDAHLVQFGHQPVRALGHVLCRSGFRGFGAELGRLRAQGSRLLLRVRALAAAALFVGGARVEVLLPAHVIDVGLTAYRVQEPHLVHHVPEQFYVVADHDQTTVVVLQESAAAR